MVQAFALVIAINAYPQAPLRGCLKDAEKMCSFLNRKYPNSLKLEVLKDLDATKDKIIKTFRKHFLVNSQIGPDDPMILYFAGHGSQTQTQKFEVLCPYDYDHRDTSTGIKDIDFRRCLEELAKKRSDNITVILDCCHSGDLTRNEDTEVLKFRSYPFKSWHMGKKPRLVARIISSLCLFLGSLRVTASGLQPDANLPFCVPSSDPSSHILLAACGKDEHAYEDEEGGCFTTLLLKYLDHGQTEDGREITYSDIDQNLASLDSHLRQRPLVLGRAGHMHRVLFGTRYFEIGSKTSLQLRKLGDRSFQVDAGRIHGIIEGAVFEITFQDEAKVWRQVTADAMEVSHFSSIIRLSDNQSIPNLDISTARTSISTYGPSLKVWVGDGTNMEVHPPTCDFIKFQSELSPSVQLVTKEDSSFLIYLHHDDADPKMEIKPRCGVPTWGTQCIHYGSGSTILHQLPRFLDAFNHFLYHVDHFYPTEHLKVSLYRLKEDKYSNRYVESSIHSDWRTGSSPTGLEAQTHYGLQIANNSPHDLHFYLFYFYLSDFSVEARRYPQADRRDFSTPKIGGFYSQGTREMKMGWDGNGGPAIYFPRTRKGRAFLKLFASTEEVKNLGIIEQSPAHMEGATRAKRVPVPGNQYYSFVYEVQID